jgi:hypothetical protein
MFYISMRNADGTQYNSGMSWSHDYDEAHIFPTQAEADFEVYVIKRENESFENGDYGIWQLKVQEYEPRLKFVSSSRTEEEDEGYGGHYVDFTIYTVPIGLTDAAIRDLVNEMHPATRCEHRYDCCGNYYASTAKWIRGNLDWSPYEDRHTVLVKQGFGQNV